jgi:hypothetical protein
MLVPERRRPCTSTLHRMRHVHLRDEAQEDSETVTSRRAAAGRGAIRLLTVTHCTHKRQVKRLIC